MISKEDALIIKDEAGLNYLIDRFNNGPAFAIAVVFDADELYARFFKGIDIPFEKFQEKHYYFDQQKNIHISESERDFVWISTMGLVATSRVTKNKFVNSFLCQQSILEHLLKDTISLCEDESVYDIDSYNYGRIEERTQSIFHNLIFYFEILLKVYLSIYGQKVPHTHKIATLLHQVKEVLFKQNHNDSIFHAFIIPMIEDAVKHLSSIPGNFKEEYIKYDDNPQDYTLLALRTDYMESILVIVELSLDIIYDMYYDPQKCTYLSQGWYNKLLGRCKTPESKKTVEEAYKFLVNENKK